MQWIPPENTEKRRPLTGCCSFNITALNPDAARPCSLMSHLSTYTCISFPAAAIKRDHTPGSWNQQKGIFSQFWRPDVSDQGAGRAGSFRRLQGRICCRFLSRFWGLPAILAGPWLVDTSHQSLLHHHTASPLSVSLCVFSSYNDTGYTGLKTHPQKQPQCPSTEEWMKKMWYIYKMEHYSALKKEWNAICSHMDGPWGYYAKWNKSERERQMLYDLTYMWNLKNTTK